MNNLQTRSTARGGDGLLPTPTNRPLTAFDRLHALAQTTPDSNIGAAYVELYSMLYSLREYDITAKVKIDGLGIHSVGGFGDVLTGTLEEDSGNALQEQASTKVAVKRFRLMVNKQRKALMNIINELVLWCRLKHRNILEFRGFMFYENLPCAVSDWMENGNLQEYLEKYPGVDKQDLAIGILRGLIYLHSEDIVHSDLKSGNILISSKGHPLLCDFGISRVLVEAGAVAGTSSLKGSLQWMAVELVNPSSFAPEEGKSHTKKSDIWSYGMVVYEILSGKLPFQDMNNDAMVIMAIINGQLPEKPVPGEMNKVELHYPALWTVCRRCWERDPKDRPSALDLVDTMELPVHLSQIHQFSAHTGSIESAAFSPTDLHILATASQDKTVCIWRLSNNWKGDDLLHRLTSHTDRANCVLWSLDGLFLFSCSDDRTIRKWDVSNGQCVFVSEPLHTELVYRISCSPDGKHIASTGKDTRIYVWDAFSGDKVMGPLIGHKEFVMELTYSPDGRYIVSGSWDKSIIVWDSKTGEKLFGPLFAHSDAVLSVAFDPAGERFVTSSEDCTVTIWDANTFTPIHKNLRAHGDAVASVQYILDGRFILSSSYDQTVKVWDPKTGRVISEPGNHDWEVWKTTFSHDGRWAASVGRDFQVRIWEIREL